MLRLLDEVSFDGRPVTGERNQALLAVLASAHPRAVPDDVLVDALWPEAQPAHPTKALQVVVSRTRSQTAGSLVARTDVGYRLDLAPGDLDTSCLAGWVTDAHRAERSGDAETARDRARSALGLAVAAASDLPEPVEEVRDAGRAARAEATAVLGRVTAALGDHDEALGLLHAVPDPDEPTLVALLRAEAAVHGAATALATYETHRARLADTLGVDPGPALQEVHASLLAADRPVRQGLHYDATPLVGRDDDVKRLRALVRQSRVTSIVGPGGLGKTRLAHLLGREAEQPVVHFVELVGVVSPDDVIGEVGSAVGVRDSVSGRRVLTPEQRADVRGRIAQTLDQAPTLLVLDNCEHVVEAVADLVATLVATTRQLRVVTTTRAPLAIAAERVFALGVLDDDSAVALFRQRAEASRPGVRLDDGEVRRVVARLDGLPLAIELAAAKVRAMSVSDIDRRLDDRFALLRGTDRTAPDRHQTLLAVIDWSWNLLGDADRRALRRLAVLADGFALDGAEALVGDDALASLESLAGQSLVAVQDGPRGLRYRMLETVREFGRLRLADAGETDDAAAALRAWALGRARTALAGLDGRRQVEVVQELVVEENNLADVLRASLAAADPEAVVTLMGALGVYWTIRGDHSRVITLVSAVDEVLADWEPPAALVDDAVRTAGIVVMNTTIGELETPESCRRLLRAHGATAGTPGNRALARALAHLEAGGDLTDLSEDPDRHVAMLALQWRSHASENAGDNESAVAASIRALELWEEDDGPWPRALHDTQLAGLYAQQGRLDLASKHAAEGLAALDALEADDDAAQVRGVLACAAIVDDDLPRAEALLQEMTAKPGTGLWGGQVVVATVRAEVAIARGQHELGVTLYEKAVEVCRAIRFPGFNLVEGSEPWTLTTEAAAVTVIARHGTGAAGRAMRDDLAARAPDVVAADRGRRDYPVVGCVLFGLGAWELLRDGDPELAVRLLALADRTAYNRYSPSMGWARIRAEADAVRPGALDAALADLGTRRGPDVLADVGTALERL